LRPRILFLTPLAAWAAVFTLGPTAYADESQVCIDASDQGQLLRIDKRLREARDQFVRCARRDCPPEVRENCARWLDDAQRAVPSIIFAIKDDLGNDASPVRVEIDGVLVTERYNGTPLVLDPGEHTFRFDVPGRATLAKTFRLAQGDQERRESIVFASTPTVSAGLGPAGGAESHSHANGLRMAGIVIGGVGLAGLAAGSVFGALAIARNDAAHCTPENVCVDSQARRDAQRFAAASTVSFAIGGALLAGGLTLVLVAPRDSVRRTASVELLPAFSSDMAGFALRGAW
jgi:hypothetical protein